MGCKHITHRLPMAASYVDHALPTLACRAKDAMHQSLAKGGADIQLKVDPLRHISLELGYTKRQEAQDLKKSKTLEGDPHSSSDSRRSQEWLNEAGVAGSFQ